MGLAEKAGLLVVRKLGYRKATDVSPLVVGSLVPQLPVDGKPRVAFDDLAGVNPDGDRILKAAVPLDLGLEFLDAGFPKVGARRYGLASPRGEFGKIRHFADCGVHARIVGEEVELVLSLFARGRAGTCFPMIAMVVSSDFIGLCLWPVAGRRARVSSRLGRGQLGEFPTRRCGKSL